MEHSVLSSQATQYFGADPTQFGLEEGQSAFVVQGVIPHLLANIPVVIHVNRSPAGQSEFSVHSTQVSE